jgi:hypothetical protein
MLISSLPCATPAPAMSGRHYYSVMCCLRLHSADNRGSTLRTWSAGYAPEEVLSRIPSSANALRIADAAKLIASFAEWETVERFASHLPARWSNLRAASSASPSPAR